MISAICWGIVDEYKSQLIKGFRKAPALTECILEILKNPERVGSVSIHQELDGPADRFGPSFWTSVFSSSEFLMKRMQTQKITEVIYRDRYLAAPLPIGLCLRTIGVILGHYEGCRARIVTGTLKSETELQREPHRKNQRENKTIQDNWRSEEERQLAVDEAIYQFGLDIVFKTGDKYSLPHARTMSLVFDDGVTVQMWLDQGFGYWWVDKYSSENELSPHEGEHLARDLLHADWRLRSGKWPTAIFFSLEA